MFSILAPAEHVQCHRWQAEELRGVRSWYINHASEGSVAIRLANYTFLTPGFTRLRLNDYRNGCPYRAHQLSLFKRSRYGSLYPDHSQLQRPMPIFSKPFRRTDGIQTTVIFRVRIESGLRIIDLRFVCTSPSDYANAIEPSSNGGAKIARAIVNLVEGRVRVLNASLFIAEGYSGIN
jgi:hypothetical protein